MIEGLLFLGVALAFAWWQFREIRRDQETARRKREVEGGQTPDAGPRDGAA